MSELEIKLHANALPQTPASLRDDESSDDYISHISHQAPPVLILPKSPVSVTFSFGNEDEDKVDDTFPTGHDQPSFDQDDDSSYSPHVSLLQSDLFARLICTESRMARCESSDSFFSHLAHTIIDSDQQVCTPFMTVKELEHILENCHTLPFNDIPNLPSISYQESELELWTALISHFAEVVTQLPIYSSIMIKSGIPPGLRGYAWKSMALAHSSTLESLYDLLRAEWTPFVKIIARDLNRTFPEIGLFQENGGIGQVMLGNVLRAYSAYDMQVGYCQGLSFVAGPLLLHMSDKDAFCVLVKLMEDYKLRSMFTADMRGLHLRMYQFDRLFKQELPSLYQHFEELGVPCIYASQWFLSLYAVTCPLSFLVRIYDVLLAQGAISTLMRVGLAVLKRNSDIFIKSDDDEFILQHLLGRSLWAVYNGDSDLFVSDLSCVFAGNEEDLKVLEDEFEAGGDRDRRENNRITARSVSSLASGSLTSLYASVGKLPNLKWRQSSGKGKTGRKDCAGHGSSASVSSISPSLSSPSMLRKSASKLSISSISTTSTVSTDFENIYKGHRSSASSFTTFDSRDLEMELDRTKALLAQEQMQRSTEKQAVKALVDNLAQLKIMRDENKDTLELDQQLSCNLAVIQQQFGLSTRSDLSLSLPHSASCVNCDKLLIELATVKSNETMVRLQLDEMKDHLINEKDGKNELTVPANGHARKWSWSRA